MWVVTDEWVVWVGGLGAGLAPLCLKHLSHLYQLYSGGRRMQACIAAMLRLHTCCMQQQHEQVDCHLSTPWLVRRRPLGFYDSSTDKTPTGHLDAPHPALCGGLFSPLTSRTVRCQSSITPCPASGVTPTHTQLWLLLAVLHSNIWLVCCVCVVCCLPCIMSSCHHTTTHCFRCVRLAASRTPELSSQIEAALKQHELARVQARVRRQTGTAAAAAAAAAGPGHLPGQQEAAAGAVACRGAAAAATAAAAAVAAGGVGGRDARNITVLTDADMAGQKLEELMAGKSRGE